MQQQQQQQQQQSTAPRNETTRETQDECGVDGNDEDVVAIATREFRRFSEEREHTQRGYIINKAVVAQAEEA